MANNKLDRLLAQLNVSGLQQKDNPTYQVISELIRQLKLLSDLIAGIDTSGGSSTTIINNTEVIMIGDDDSSEGDGDGGDTFIIQQGSDSGSSTDHVVMSDGATPIPSPVDDGFGNFIYIEYTP